MKTTIDTLTENHTLTGTIRILTGSTHSGKESVYITGTPAGLRFLSRVLEAQAHALEHGGTDNSFSKFLREDGTLFFATDDSVDIFEIHCHDELPEPHLSERNN